MHCPSASSLEWIYSESTHLGYEDKADCQSGGEEGEERRECVGGVDLFFDHERGRHADQTQHDHVVHADTCHERRSTGELQH